MKEDDATADDRHRDRTTSDEAASDEPHPKRRADTKPAAGRRRHWSRLLRLAATGLVLAFATVAAYVVWQFYVTAPWTRDGRVRVQVVNLAPQVAGTVVELRVTDNQEVKRGDVLYVIDPFDYQEAVVSAEAEIKNREADLSVKEAQSARRAALSTVSTSVADMHDWNGGHFICTVC